MRFLVRSILLIMLFSFGLAVFDNYTLKALMYMWGDSILMLTLGYTQVISLGALMVTTAIAFFVNAIGVLIRE